MKVLITGGTGFIGRMLAEKILARGKLTGPSGKPETIDELVLFDAVLPPMLPKALQGHAKAVAGDVSDKVQIDALIDRPDMSVFHLASIVSAGVTFSRRAGDWDRSRASCSRVRLPSSGRRE